MDVTAGNMNDNSAAASPRRWSPTDPRIERIAKTRERILQVAADLFLEEGFTAVSMDRIALTAGVAKMTLYRQFKDKNTLFVETINGTWIDIAPRLEPASSLEETRENLTLFGRAFIKGVLSPKVLRLNQIMMAETTRIPELGTLFHSLSVEPAIEAVKHILSATFPPEELALRAGAFLQMVAGSAYGRVLLGVEVPTAEPFEAQLALATRLILADVDTAGQGGTPPL
jgi:TetR/AcrR family transcriptional repressor of mexJK operon